MINGKETNLANTKEFTSNHGLAERHKVVERGEPKSAGVLDKRTMDEEQESPTKPNTVEKLPQSKDIQDTGPTWIDAICVVTFDLDEGQLVEYMLPPKGLTPQDQKLLSLLSFPDSNSFGSEGSCKYVFSLKKSSSHF